MRRWLLGLACFAASFLLVSDRMALGDYLYFIENDAGTISRANTDGTGIETLVTSLSSPRYVDVDASKGTMYWTASSGIQRANVGGTGVEDVLTGLALPNGIALDRTAGKIYWTQLLGDETVRRSNLDGSGIDDLITRVGSQNFHDITLDIANGHMYWADDNGATPGIWKANLDGSSATQIVSGTTAPLGIDLDLTNNKVYWTDGVLDKIIRSNLDGSSFETIIDSGLDKPGDIKLDVANNIMYWSDSDRGVIERASLDGTGRQTIITGLTDPYGLALDFGVVPEPSTMALWSVVGLIGCIIAWRRRRRA